MASLADGQEGAAPGALSHVPRAVGHGQRIGPVARQGDMSVTLVLAPRDATGLLAKARGAIGYRRADVDAVHRPDGATQRRVVGWCTARGLEASASADGYLVEAHGAVADIEAAFGTRVDSYVVGRVRGRAIRSEPALPANLQGDVLAVLGLNDLARPWRGRPKRPGGAAGASGPASGAGYLPADIRQAYGLPDPSAGLDGSGEVAVVFEFGSAYTNADLLAFWQQARVPVPQVSSLWALGPGQEPPAAPPLSADVEATADVEWLGALAPGAQVVVVNANAGDTDATFAQALARALAAALSLEPTPAVISISYGDAEAFFGPAELKALDILCARAAARGVSVVAASGDSGAYGVPVPVGALESVDAPACLTHVLAVGGTRLELSDGVVARELGWSDSGGTGASGGGVSAVFALPSWQDAEQVAEATGGLSGRGVPDVCAAADPLTGYRIVLADLLYVVGGTSLAAPVWAAGLTIVAQARRRASLAPLGLAARAVYPLGSRPTRIRDILVGDNAFLSAAGYRCRTGWDAVTGLGAPAGRELWEELAGLGRPEFPRPGPRRRAHTADDSQPSEAGGPSPEPDPEPAVGAVVAASVSPRPAEATPSVEGSDGAPKADPLPDGESRVKSVFGPAAPAAAPAPDESQAELPRAAESDVGRAETEDPTSEPPPAARASVAAKAPLTPPSALDRSSAQAVETALAAEPETDAPPGAASGPDAPAESGPGSKPPRAGRAPNASPARTKRASAAASSTRRLPAPSASGSGRRRRGPG